MKVMNKEIKQFKQDIEEKLELLDDELRNEYSLEQLVFEYKKLYAMYEGFKLYDDLQLAGFNREKVESGTSISYAGYIKNAYPHI